MSDDIDTKKLRAELRDLRDQLDEERATLDAIRSGSVDALIVGSAGSERVFTLEGADHPYRVLIEAMQQGAATLSADGTILYCNQSLAEMLQLPQERVSGTALSMFVPIADHTQLQRMIRQAQTSHSLGEINFRTGPSGLLPVQIALSALPLPGSTALGLIVTDLTDKKQQEELVAAHRRKDDFLAILAHELRNPLAPIRNALHLLKSPRATDGMNEHAREMIERQVGNLTRLVDELLDVSRISRGKIQLRLEPIELVTIVQRAAEAARPLLEVRNHRLTVRLGPEPLWIDGDPARLEQVVVNLLNNAAKYTEPGGRIEVKAERDQSDIVLHIKDNGVGIASDMLPHVFEMFTQADHSLHRTQGGLGIGLTLVRSLVNLHGGQITGHSDGLGKGSEFVVRLPALAVPTARAPTTNHDSAVLADRSLRVAVIDDNIDAGDSLGMLLRLYGHEVEVFQSGRTALDNIKQSPPDVVLLDIGLPDLDGYQVANRLRQQPHGRDILLVAITGYGQEDDRKRTAAAGFDYHIVKPVDPVELESLIIDKTRKSSIQK